jgi:Chaperone of endosialidase
VGAGTLALNTADQNTAIGAGSLLSNTTGSLNTASGAFALFTNSTGGTNVAVGNSALYNNSTGSGNIALGHYAGFNVGTGSNVICIGHIGDNTSNTTWIENVYGVTTIGPGLTAPVIVSEFGQLGTTASSERFKMDIATMDNASEMILSLRPVTFHYKNDAKKIPQFGLIAEEVAKVNPALVLPDKEGKPYTVRYDQINAMLLNEFLKERRRIEEQEVTIAQLRKQMETVVARLKEHDSEIETVKAQIEVKARPRVVANEQ